MSLALHPVWGPVLLSVRVALVATVVVMPVGVALAWVLSKTRLPGRSFLAALLNLPLVLPPVVTGFFLLDLLGRKGWLGSVLSCVGVEIPFTWMAAAVAAGVVSLPMAVWTVKVALDGVDEALENAARVLGRSEWEVFFRITLPLARRGLLGGLVLVFARSLGEFGATIVLAGATPGETLTIPTAVYLYMHQDGMEPTVRILVWIAAAISFASLLVVNATVWSAREGRS